MNITISSKQILALVAAIIAALALYWLVITGGQGFSYAQPYQFLSVIAMLAAIVFAALFMYLAFGTKLTPPRFASGVAWFLVVALLLALLIMSLGFMQDLAGASCRGFFGSAASCTSNQYIIVVVTILNPFAIPVYTFLLTAGSISLVRRLLSRSSTVSSSMR